MFTTLDQLRNAQKNQNLFNSINKNNFFDVSFQRLGIAFELGNAQQNSYFVPYSSPTNHALAVIYPITDLLKPIYGLVRIFEGAIILFGLLFHTSPDNKPSDVVKGMGLELFKILIVDMVNLANAILNLISRSLTTLFLNYDASTKVKCETGNHWLTKKTPIIEIQDLDEGIKDCSLNLRV